MGIRFNTVRLLAETLKQLGDVSGKKLLTLGVQDCYFTYDEILQFLRRHGVPYHSLNPGDIKETTGFKWAQGPEAQQYRDCIHQTTFFRLLGFKPENICSLDASNYEGADIVHDLNAPVEESFYSRFDLIFDAGTIHYVFSVKDAFFNVGHMCKVGGAIINFNPIDYSDSGFVGLNADLFRDFYLHNGFEAMELKYIAIPRHRRINEHYLEFSCESFSYSLQPYYTTSVYSVFRKSEEKSLKVPIQSFWESIYVRKAMDHSSPHSMVRKILSVLLRDAVGSYFIPTIVTRGLIERMRAKRVNL